MKSEITIQKNSFKTCILKSQTYKSLKEFSNFGLQQFFWTRFLLLLFPLQWFDRNQKVIKNCLPNFIPINTKLFWRRDKLWRYKFPWKTWNKVNNHCHFAYNIPNPWKIKNPAKSSLCYQSSLFNVLMFSKSDQSTLLTIHFQNIIINSYVTHISIKQYATWTYSSAIQNTNIFSIQ